MKPEYEKLSDKERQTILEEKGTLLSDEEWREINRRFSSPMGQMIGAIGSRMPRINKRADGKGLCRLRKPKPGYTWHGEDSQLACVVDDIIDKHQQIKAEP